MEKTEGFVLKNIPYRRADRKVVLFSKDRGKFSFIARSYSNPKTKYFGRLEVPSYVEVMYVRRKRFHGNLYISGLSGFYILLRGKWIFFILSFLF